MANGNDQIDIADAIRKRNLLIQDLPTITNPNQQPTIPQFSQQPTFDEKPPGYDPDALKKYTEQSEEALKDIQTNRPDYEKQRAAAQAYGSPQAPIVPGQYQRNKLATAVLAPFMLGQIMRNPAQGIENFNQLTRRGYLQAEQQRATTLDQQKRQFDATTAVVNQDNKNLLDKLAVAKSGIDVQKMVMDYNADAQKYGPDIALLRSNALIAQHQAELVGKPITKDGLWNVWHEDPKNPGKLIATPGWMQTTDNNKIQWKGADDKLIPGVTRAEPLKDMTSAAPLDQMIAKDVAAKEAQLGRPVTNEEFSKISLDDHKKWEQVIADREAATAGRTTARETENRRQINLEATKRLYSGRLTAITDPMQRNLNAIKTAQTSFRAALGESDPQQRKNKEAAAIAPLEQIRSQLGTTRLNMGEYKLLGQAQGGPLGLIAEYNRLTGAGLPVPEQMITDLEKLNALITRDGQALLNIYTKGEAKIRLAPTDELATKAWNDLQDQVNWFRDPDSDPAVQALKDKGYNIR